MIIQRFIQRICAAFMLIIGLGLAEARAGEPFLESSLIFKPEVLHNHGSCIVEAPNGDLLVCWFNGSGERKADDVKIEGARKRKGEKQWSKRFTMADTLDYPDTNCAMIIDPQGRLWLFWPTIMANLWESSLMKYRISTNYLGEGAPVWQWQEVLHVTPGEEFIGPVEKWLAKTEERVKALEISGEEKKKLADYLADIRRQTNDKLSRRLGWMTRAHPFILDNSRMIVPLYSDGFSFSLMAYTDDWGQTWKTGLPLPGEGNIQPSIVRRKDGTLYTLMRDNGPAPMRLLQSSSKDRGHTWSEVTDSELPNPGSGAEIINLQNGWWALISNDSEEERHSLAVQISDDEGKSWKWKRRLEFDPKKVDRFHYPSLIQAKDGTLHASYSYHLHADSLPKDVDGDPAGKSIKHAHFNLEWVMAGEKK